MLINYLIAYYIPQMAVLFGLNYMRSIITWLFCCISLLGCSEQNTAKISISPQINNAVFNCQSAIQQDSKSWQLAQLFLFAHNIKYQDQDNNWHTLKLADNKYQSQQVALLGVDCEDTDEQNWQLALQDNIAVEDMQAIRMTIGVPFALNHVNPLSQDSPLNVPNMFWVWQTGHKFVRMEMNASDDGYWLFHLGSTGCSSASSLRAPNSPCLYPNTFTIDLNKAANHHFELAIDNWFQGLIFDDDSSCQSHKDNPYCQQIFDNLNINYTAVAQ